MAAESHCTGSFCEEPESVNPGSIRGVVVLVVDGGRLAQKVPETHGHLLEPHAQRGNPCALFAALENGLEWDPSGGREHPVPLRLDETSECLAADLRLAAPCGESLDGVR
eukprot:CAMPEP_0170387926 /NCGR_PEP_ID=MMETSP0117_2-20130122/17820_1 /TAXON_ID=400756 /ORGANISM="Durinskia baltica, Strain CSIRO CS-38" /LENGTH=109 /DNA_ID=CAMNT_0010643831 /DNA_START=110 /DNA_END=436 /DNA_ORIENTATION=-